MKDQDNLIIYFILIFIGTLTLLLNEFVFDLGRGAVLIFGAANVIGLIGLGIALFKNDDTALDE